MKRILLLLAVFVSSSLVSTALIWTRVSPAKAEDNELRNVGNALIPSTASERFFESGQQQLEEEIQRLQQGFNVLTSDILKIDPVIFQQKEQHLLDGVHAPQNQTLPIEPLRESVH